MLRICNQCILLTTAQAQRTWKTGQSLHHMTLLYSWRVP